MDEQNLEIFNFRHQKVSSLSKNSLFFCSTNTNFINVLKDDSNEIFIEVSEFNELEDIKNKFNVPLNDVYKIIYCKEANYLALLGLGDDNLGKIFVYFNWWLENKENLSFFKILNEIDSKKDVLIYNKSNLNLIQINTNYCKDEIQGVQICCCEKSGNLLISYDKTIDIYKFIKVYYIDDKEYTNNFVHLLKLNISFNAQHFRIIEQLLLCSSNSHCQLINLDFKANIQIKSNIVLKETKIKKNSDEELINKNNNLIFLPCFQNKSLKITNNHLNEIIGPISDDLCCKIQIDFDECLQVEINNINILFCSNLLTSKSLKLEQQFEIIEKDGYSQVYHKEKNLACKTFLIPIYDENLKLETDPLETYEITSWNPLHSLNYSKLIYFNLFVFKNNSLIYFLIDKNLKIQKYKLDEIVIKNLQLKSVIIEDSFIYILTESNLYTYYFGLLKILKRNHQINLTETFSRNSDELFKIIRPLLLNKNYFLCSHHLINTDFKLLLVSKYDQTYTKYILFKPFQKQLLIDSKKINMKENDGKNLSFLFYIIDLCENLELDEELRSFYLESCLQLFKLLINYFPFTTLARRIIIEFFFKYTNLKLIDLIKQDDQFLFKRFFTEKIVKCNTILEDILYEINFENQSTNKFSDNLDKKSLGKKIFQSLDDKNALNLLNFLISNSNNKLIVYFIMEHEFKNLDDNLFMKLSSEKNLFILAKSKLLFDTNNFDKLKIYLEEINEINFYNELNEYKNYLIYLPEFLKHLIDVNLNKMLGFLNDLISSNISSEVLFNIIEDDKQLFIILDNYISLTKSEKLPDKLLTNLLVNYWKILNNELNYKELLKKFKIVNHWNIYQTPFINLLRPNHQTEANLYSDSDIKNNEKKDCSCNLCSSAFNKLQFILDNYSSEEIKNLFNHLIKMNNEDWLWRIKVQIIDFSSAINILYDKCPETILFYILEFKKMNQEKWIFLIDFLNTKQLVNGLDSKLNHKILYHLANTIEPIEFINLIPEEWKPITNYYFKICLEKYQAKCVHNQIMYHLDRNFLDV